MIDKEREIILTAPFPKELAYQLRVQAAIENMSRAALIRKAVRQYLGSFPVERLENEKVTRGERK